MGMALRNVVTNKTCGPSMEFGNDDCWFLRTGENQSTQRKTSWCQEENLQQQTQLLHEFWAILLEERRGGGRKSHYRAIPIPHRASKVRASEHDPRKGKG